MKILIIDDDVSAATTLQALLNQQGYSVDVAYSGQERQVTQAAGRIGF